MNKIMKLWIILFLFFAKLLFATDNFEIIKKLDCDFLDSITQVISNESNIFIAQRNNILKFNKNGEFKEKIGEKGNGPGEFRKIHSFCIYKENLFILDSYLRRLNIFSINGDFIRSFRINIIGNFFVTDNMIYMNNPFTPTNTKLPDKIIIYDFYGNEKRKILKNHYVGTDISKALYSNSCYIYVKNNRIFCFKEFQRELNIYNLNTEKQIVDIIWDKKFKIKLPNISDKRRLSFFTNPSFVSMLYFEDNFYCVYFKSKENNITRIAKFDISGRYLNDIIVSGEYPYILILNNNLHLISEDFILIRLFEKNGR